MIIRSIIIKILYIEKYNLQKYGINFSILDSLNIKNK